MIETRKPRRLSNLSLALLLLAMVGLACSVSDETSRANKLVEAGNAAVQEAKTLVTEAEGLKQKMLQMDVKRLDEARATAKQAVAAYDKARDKLKEAAKKYEEASQLKIKDKFKEYLLIKVREYEKRAELVETAKGTPQALIDAEDRSSFVTRANANNERVDKLSQEADDLAKQAEKLQKDIGGTLK